jgi:hypothetical protein
LEALREGAYDHDTTVHGALINKVDGSVSKRAVEFDNGISDTATERFYNRPPSHEFKETFSKWVTSDERATEEIFDSFKEIIRGLYQLLKDLELLMPTEKGG